jgi:hypothetical protein
MTDGPDLTPPELRADVERARADLGDTVAALAAKADVKARVLDRAEGLRDGAAARARRSAASARAMAGDDSVRRGGARAALAAGGAALAAGAVVYGIRRRRRS